MSTTSFKFELGEVLKDKITGFTGVVMVRSQYLTGCLHYGLQSRKIGEKGKTSDWEHFDENRLVSIGKKVMSPPGDVASTVQGVRRKASGGPAPAPRTIN